MRSQVRAWGRIFGACSLLTQVAIAQPDASSSAPQPATAPASTAPTTQSTTVTASTVAPQSAPAAVTPAAAAVAIAAPGSCRLGDHAGFDPIDAQTAAALVCRDLPAEAHSGATSYRVDLEKLGTISFVTLSSESNGQVTDSRRLKIDKIEDIPTVSPRLVDSLVHGKPLKDSEQVGNLTTADSTAPMQKSGQMQIGVGILGAMAPGIASVSPGLQLALRYDTPRWVLTTQLRLAWSTGGAENQFDMTQFGVGPRYMFSTSDTSLFVGGGMVVERLSKTSQIAYGAGNIGDSTAAKSGIGAYGEFGLEMMRLHRNRLDVAIRADFPTFSVGGDYLVPISLSTSFVFD